MREDPGARMAANGTVTELRAEHDRPPADYPRLFDDDADGTDVADGTDGTDGEAGQPRPGGRFRTPVVVVVVLVVLALVGALVASTLALRNQQALSSARTSGLAAARTYAVELGSYSYRHLAEDFATVERHSTPSFARSFTQSSDALRSVLERYHATADATVVAAGLTSATTTSAEALVFLNQKVTNATQAHGPTTDQSRLQISMVRSGGRWLIERVHLL